jgi:hypothetical protein
MLLSGGAITLITYSVFDRSADKLDPSIKDEPWRAFATVKMRVTIDKDPEFEVTIEEKQVEPGSVHTAPGLALIHHLSHYFPIMAKAYQGRVIA